MLKKFPNGLGKKEKSRGGEDALVAEVAYLASQSSSTSSKTWSQFEIPTAIDSDELLITQTTDGNIVLASRGDGTIYAFNPTSKLFVSTSIPPLADPSYYKFLAPLPNNGILACTAGRSYYTTYDGASWTLHDWPLINGDFAALINMGNFFDIGTKVVIVAATWQYGNTISVYVFDKSANTMTGYQVPFPTGVTSGSNPISCTNLAKTKVYIVGHWNPNMFTERPIIEFDIATTSFTEKTAVVPSWGAGTMTAISSDEILLFGGYVFDTDNTTKIRFPTQIYTIGADFLSPTTEPPRDAYFYEPVCIPTSMKLENDVLFMGQFFVWNGCDYTPLVPSNVIMKYHIATATWSADYSKSYMSVPLSYLCTDGSLYTVNWYNYYGFAPSLQLRSAYQQITDLTSASWVTNTDETHMHLPISVALNANDGNMYLLDDDDAHSINPVQYGIYPTRSVITGTEFYTPCLAIVNLDQCSAAIYPKEGGWNGFYVSDFNQSNFGTMTSISHDTLYWAMVTKMTDSRNIIVAACRMTGPSTYVMAEITYDPVLNVIDETPSTLLIPRKYGAIFPNPDDQTITVLGGESPTGTPIQAIEVYNLSTSTVTTITPGLNCARSNGATYTLITEGPMKNKVAVVGGTTGNEFEVYDLATRTSIVLAPGPVSGLSGHQTLAFYNETWGQYLYVIGGSIDSVPQTACYVYSFTLDQWITMAHSLNTARSGHSATFYGTNPLIVVTGGTLTDAYSEYLSITCRDFKPKTTAAAIDVAPSIKTSLVTPVHVVETSLVKSSAAEPIRIMRLVSAATLAKETSLGAQYASHAMLTTKSVHIPGKLEVRKREPRVIHKKRVATHKL